MGKNLKDQTDGRFIKGHKGPGRPKLTARARKAKKLTQSQAYDIMGKFLLLSKEELKDELELPSTTVLEHIVGSICLKAMEQGDPTRAEWLYQRLFGKVAQEVNAQVTNTVQISQQNAAELYQVARNHAHQNVLDITAGEDDGT